MLNHHERNPLAETFSLPYFYRTVRKKFLSCRFFHFQTFNELIMERSEIQKRVKEVVGRVLETDISEIADDANFIFDLGADSMQSLELVAGFEEEFDVELDEDKALEVQNLDDAVDFISASL